jgi:hypothetical protein
MLELNKMDMPHTLILNYLFQDAEDNKDYWWDGHVVGREGNQHVRTYEDGDNFKDSISMAPLMQDPLLFDLQEVDLQFMPLDAESASYLFCRG